MSPPASPSPSYEELVALVVDLTSRLELAHGRIAELEARLGRGSMNSSQPPSADSITAKAKRRADRSFRERSADRKPGGQPGRKGSGLAPTTEPDRTETVAVPLRLLREDHHREVPFGAAGTVTYGPNVNAAAILLGIEGNVPVERIAMLMEALLGAPVSTGFVARAVARFAQHLAGAGFDEAMKTALVAEEVLWGDETPTNVIGKDTDAHGELVLGSPHAVTVRTPDARLVSYAPIGSRSKTTLAALGVLEGYAGYLVRDDYVGWHQFDTQLAVQQCAAHLIYPNPYAASFAIPHRTVSIRSTVVPGKIVPSRTASLPTIQQSTARPGHDSPPLILDRRRNFAKFRLQIADSTTRAT